MMEKDCDNKVVKQMRSLGIISDFFLQKDFTHKKKYKKYKM